jgi:outer membrane biosynthesis protein TonB
MEVLIRPDGTVKSSRVLGGNPVLLQSAADAVRKWRFESATEETAEIVMVTFEPD